MTKLTKPQQKWVKRIKAAGGVMKYYNQLGNVEYICSTKAIPIEMIIKLKDLGLLVPRSDGLFGDSQTYDILDVDLNVV